MMLSCEDTDSKVADHDSEDEVQSDTEEGFVDEIQEEQPTPSGSNILEEQSSTEQPVSTSAFRRIVALQQRTIGLPQSLWQQTCSKNFIS